MNHIFIKAESDYKGLSRGIDNLLTSHDDSVNYSKQDPTGHINFSGPREFLLQLKQKLHTLQVANADLN